MHSFNRRNNHLEKRQRTRSASAEETTPVRPTTRRVRPSTTAPDPEDVSSTTVRSRNNSPAVTTPVRSTAATTQPTSNPIPIITSRETTSSSSSIGGNTAAGDAGNRSTNSSGSSTNVGLIVGVVIAVLGALALGFLLFFFIRKRRAASKGSVGGRKEKADDEQSFIGAGGLATSHGEKYGMSSMGHSGAGNQWANTSELSYVHTPSGSGHPSQDSQHFAPTNFNEQPPPNMAYIPPQAAMMSHPADRMSVTNPYTAAQILNNNGMPAIAEDSPFDDPQWANKVFQVTRTFQPSMPDELIIMPGDRIRILMAYDDGWCLGENLDSVPANSPHQPLKGVFPRDCVEEIGLAQQSLASAPSMPAINESVDSSPAPPGPFAPALMVTNGLPANDSPPVSRSESPTKGAELQRAPTLPPLDVGARASETFAGTSHLSSAEDVAGMTAESKPSHLSTSSSIHNSSDIIDGFPGVPNKATATASETESGTHTPVKRSSSLIAGKDKELFAALELGDEADQLK